MRRLPQCQAAMAVAQVMLWLGPGTAWGQDAPATQPAASASQPADFGPPPPPERGAFTLNVSDLYVGMEMDYLATRNRSSRGIDGEIVHKNRDLRVVELFGVGMNGDIGDPNLFDYRADLEFGLTQSRFEEDVESFSHTDSDNGFLSRYDISADLFKDKPVSFNVFARRSDDRIGRRFLPSLREVQNEAGITGVAVTGPVTTDFGFTWRDIARTGNRQEEDDEELQTTRAYLSSRWDISEHHRLRLNFEHEDQGSNYQGSLYNFDLKRDEVRLDHELEFGPGHKHRLDTYVRYNEESGDLERDVFEFVPRLTLQHTDKFRTVYRYGMYRVEQDAIEFNQHKFDLDALYQATRHLRFSANNFAFFERADRDVDTVQWGTGGDIGYYRPTSSGDFNANLHVAYDALETHGSAGRRLVRNEAHALGDVRATILRNRHVVIHSVLAHSENYTRVYVPGVDYLVATLGDRALITRVPWGRIGRDEVVYFDYFYEVPAEAEVQSWWTSLILEHRFKFGLVPYYLFDGRFEDVDESTFGTPVFRDNQNRHRIGARFERDWWNVGAEYEIFDDTIEPYDAIHFTGNTALLRRVDHTLDLRGQLSRYWFEGGLDDRRVWWADAELSDSLRIRDDLSMLTATAFHWEDDSVAGKTHGVDLEWGLRYIRGYLTVDLTLEYDLLAIAENREQAFGVFLNVRRDLSHVLTGRKPGGGK